MRTHYLIIVPALFLPLFSACAEQIVPKGWVTPEQLEQAEVPIQNQLDTGRGMGGSAWSMAAVKDARLLLIYLAIYEGLPDKAQRDHFYSEQQIWLAARQNAVRAITDPKGGSMVSLEQAAEHMIRTDRRIADLKIQLHKLKK